MRTTDDSVENFAVAKTWFREMNPKQEENNTTITFRMLCYVLMDVLLCEALQREETKSISD